MHSRHHPRISKAATLVCLGLITLLAACAHAPNSGGDAEAVSVIVQAPDMLHAKRAVALAGGTVTHELGIIRSVGATVTPSQLELLRKVRDVQIREDHSVTLSDGTVTETAREESNAVEIMAIEASVNQETTKENP